MRNRIEETNIVFAYRVLHLTRSRCDILDFQNTRIDVGT